ncbi:MAG: permease-like cell division protein FtsX [Lachnospiraceae bacterium]|nr:permease-like cell division protein FtsX [Lachnospiraceae bacterium]MBQ3516514.1 permease-like cell division protein FtsX [Lachnospiraceae bacterium]
MKISTFFYTLRQGIINVFRNKWFTLASLATISACLFIFGIAYSLLVNFQHMVKTAEEGVSITVFYDEGLPQEEIDLIGAQIEARTEVSKVVFVSADEAWAEFSAELGEAAEGITENPLVNSANHEVYLNDVSAQAHLVKYIEQIEGVRKVNQSEFTANLFTGVNSLVTYVSIGMIAILLSVSVFLISNTVTIGISVRKEEITVMKYIGATDFFVRAPFVFEGMIIGLIGSALPLVLLYYIYEVALKFLAEKFAFLSSLLVTLPVWDVFMVLIPVSLVIGVGIGFFGSFFTVRKHLKV